MNTASLLPVMLELLAKSALIALAAALMPTITVPGPAREGRQPTTTREENR